MSDDRMIAAIALVVVTVIALAVVSVLLVRRARRRTAQNNLRTLLLQGVPDDAVTIHLDTNYIASPREHDACLAKVTSWRLADGSLVHAPQRPGVPTTLSAVRSISTVNQHNRMLLDH